MAKITTKVNARIVRAKSKETYQDKFRCQTTVLRATRRELKELKEDSAENKTALETTRRALRRALAGKNRAVEESVSAHVRAKVAERKSVARTEEFVVAKDRADTLARELVELKNGADAVDLANMRSLKIDFHPDFVTSVIAAARSSGQLTGTYIREILAQRVGYNGIRTLPPETEPMEVREKRIARNMVVTAPDRDPPGI